MLRAVPASASSLMMHTAPGHEQRVKALSADCSFSSPTWNETGETGRRFQRCARPAANVAVTCRRHYSDAVIRS